MIALYRSDGTATVLDQPAPASLAVVNELVGEPGMAIVRLHPALAMCGFVNDSGHVNGLPRNVLGSLMLVALGAGMSPYAGPVVITGWEDTHGQSSEIRDLTAAQVAQLEMVHAAVVPTMAGGIGRWAAVGEALGTDFPVDMQERMLRYAATIETAPTPQIEVLHDDDALAWLAQRLQREVDGYERACASMERQMDKLERENHELKTEVRELRLELARYRAEPQS